VPHLGALWAGRFCPMSGSPQNSTTRCLVERAFFVSFEPIATLDNPSRLWVQFQIPRQLGMSPMAKENLPKNELQGTLDLLVLKTLAHTGSLHGYGIVLHIQRASDELLRVEEGSLYPALHRMEQSGWIASDWALTETNRKAKYYKLTAAGRRQLRFA